MVLWLSKLRACFIALIAVALFASVTAKADNLQIGSWDQSGRTLEDRAFSPFVAALTSDGHSVASSGAISSDSMLKYCVFFMQEALRSITSGEKSVLLGWLNKGGVLAVLADSGGTGVATSNSILSDLGTPISMSAGAAVPGAIVASPFSNTPHNLVGTTFNSSPAAVVSGGSIISQNYVHYFAVGAGYVLVFGDALNHYALGGGNTATANYQLFDNICFVGDCAKGGSNGGGGHPPAVPEVSTVATSGVSLSLLAIWARKFRKRRN